MKLCARALPPPGSWTRNLFLRLTLRRGSASGKVVGRATKAMHFPAEFLNDYPTSDFLEKRFATFVALNRLDARCMTMLKGLPKNLLREVMDHEFVVAVDWGSPRGTNLRRQEGG